MLDLFRPLTYPERPHTAHEFLTAIAARTKLIQDWQDSRSGNPTQGTPPLPEIKNFLYPFNAVVTHYVRFWGGNKPMCECTDSAYRMGSQLLIEESEVESAPWVRLWIGHPDEAPGSTPPELIALREWLDSTSGGEQIPDHLLARIDRLDPLLERKSRSEWLENPVGAESYTALPEELRLAHQAVAVIPRLVPQLAKLLEVAITTLENELNRQPEDITRARGEAILESSQSGIPTGTTALHTPRGTPQNLVRHAG